MKEVEGEVVMVVVMVVMVLVKEREKFGRGFKEGWGKLKEKTLKREEKEAYLVKRVMVVVMLLVKEEEYLEEVLLKSSDSFTCFNSTSCDPVLLCPHI